MLDKLSMELLCIIVNFIEDEVDFFSFTLVCKRLSLLHSEKIINKFVCHYDKVQYINKYKFSKIILHDHKYFNIPDYVEEIEFDLEINKIDESIIPDICIELHKFVNHNVKYIEVLTKIIAIIKNDTEIMYAHYGWSEALHFSNLYDFLFDTIKFTKRCEQIYNMSKRFRENHKMWNRMISLRPYSASYMNSVENFTRDIIFPFRVRDRSRQINFWFPNHKDYAEIKKILDHRKNYKCKPKKIIQLDGSILESKKYYQNKYLRKR